MISLFLLALGTISFELLPLAAQAAGPRPGLVPPRSLSVLYFENLTGDEAHAWLSKGLSDMLTSDLSGLGAMALVERERLEKLLAEMELALSGLMDPAKAPQLGAFLNAEALLYGSYSVMGQTLRIDARVVAVGNGAVLAAASSSGALEALSQVEWELSSRIAAGLGLPVPAMTAVATKALDSYYKGLDLMDAGRPADALAFFGEAVQADPLFSKPGRGLEEAWRYLKKFKEQRWRREINALVEDIQAMMKRLNAPVFYSFADALMKPEAFGFANAAAVSELYNAHPTRLNGDTPVMAIWNLQNALGELADKADEYFDDQVLVERCRDEILSLAKQAFTRYAGDKDLPEVLYQTLFVYREREQWALLKDGCEELMGNWPDHRMMWAVEGMYERALEELGE